jgi:hypothetical protein
VGVMMDDGPCDNNACMHHTRPTSLPTGRQKMLSMCPKSFVEKAADLFIAAPLFEFVGSKSLVCCTITLSINHGRLLTSYLFQQIPTSSVIIVDTSVQNERKSKQYGND